MSATTPLAPTMTVPAVPGPRIAVVIPCFRVRDHVLDVIARIGPEVGWIFVVDDACPEGSGRHVREHCRDPRVRVLVHERNQGVGGAVVTGYRAALDTPAVAVAKLDGDGQMDPALLARFAQPVLDGRADYAKGNRFHSLGSTRGMPALRLFGNAALSFLSKLSTGYWQVFDPTNGYTVIRRDLLALLPLDAVARRYFFESDLLHHLGLVRAVVVDVPMQAVYGDEPSSLSPLRTIVPFALGHARNFARRVVYQYFVRGFSLASVELALGLALLAFGAGFGGWHWWLSIAAAVPATAGTVMVAGLSIIVGMQLVLSWLAFDIASEPRTPVGPLLG